MAGEAGGSTYCTCPKCQKRQHVGSPAKRRGSQAIDGTISGAAEETELQHGENASRRTSQLHAQASRSRQRHSLPCGCVVETHAGVSPTIPNVPKHSKASRKHCKARVEKRARRSSPLGHTRQAPHRTLRAMDDVLRRDTTKDSDAYNSTGGGLSSTANDLCSVARGPRPRDTLRRKHAFGNSDSTASHVQNTQKNPVQADSGPTLFQRNWVRYDKEESKLLWDLKAEGLSWDEIELHFRGRTRDSLQNRYAFLIRRNKQAARDSGTSSNVGHSTARSDVSDSSGVEDRSYHEEPSINVVDGHDLDTAQNTGPSPHIDSVVDGHGPDIVQDPGTFPHTDIASRATFLPQQPHGAHGQRLPVFERSTSPPAALEPQHASQRRGFAPIASLPSTTMDESAKWTPRKSHFRNLLGI